MLYWQGLGPTHTQGEEITLCIESQKDTMIVRWTMETSLESLCQIAILNNV